MRHTRLAPLARRPPSPHGATSATPERRAPTHPPLAGTTHSRALRLQGGTARCPAPPPARRFSSRRAQTSRGSRRWRCTRRPSRRPTRRPIGNVDERLWARRQVRSALPHTAALGRSELSNARRTLAILVAVHGLYCATQAHCAVQNCSVRRTQNARRAHL